MAGSPAAAAAKSLQSCPTPCDPIDGSPPGSAVPGILQARTLEWVAISFSNAWKWKVKVKSLSRDPMDCSPPGSSIHGIFQARVLEWGAIHMTVQVCKESSLRIQSLMGVCPEESTESRLFCVCLFCMCDCFDDPWWKRYREPRLEIKLGRTFRTWHKKLVSHRGERRCEKIRDSKLWKSQQSGSREGKKSQNILQRRRQEKKSKDIVWLITATAANIQWAFPPFTCCVHSVSSTLSYGILKRSPQVSEPSETQDMPRVTR